MLDLEVLRTDVLSLLADLLVHGGLLLVQVLYHLTQSVVHCVEALELLIHILGLILHVLDFLFSGPDLALQLLDLVVKHELELFKFLGTLLELVNLLLFIADETIRLFNLLILGLDVLILDEKKCTFLSLSFYSCKFCSVISKFFFYSSISAYSYF